MHVDIFVFKFMFVCIILIDIPEYRFIYNYLNKYHIYCKSINFLKHIYNPMQNTIIF